jgi:heme/copper-type cytochrome/quinol oxidase subunit 1
MSFFKNFYLNIQFINDLRRHFCKKYLYTINHKRIALNYLYFSILTALCGTLLATMIRLELAQPGSQFFKGDSLRYLQVITAHGLVMIFFVVIPILFGLLANFLIPYHVGSKDVAFPRLNSIGFWLLPFAFLLVSKPAFIRQQYFRYYERPSYFFPLLSKNFRHIFKNISENYFYSKTLLLRHSWDDNALVWTPRKKFSVDEMPNNVFTPYKLMFWQLTTNFPESFWYVASRATRSRRRKVFFSKCSNRAAVVSGWTFITPFSSNLKYTGMGAQDLLIIAVILAGVSTTISFTNLLITRRTLAASGLRNRRVLLPFISITLFLTMRMLTLITPVLGGAMIMLYLDRHWQTSFFDYTYGGDTILFAHLFWFFGHPEVYVVIIPAFGIVNMVIPYANTRRIASKHHLIWATYIMAYMGYLVWGHHMYLVGLDHRSRAMFSTITVMISLPAIVKIVNWTLTFLNSALRMDTTMIFVFMFILYFLVGGLTGMWLSHVSLNVYVHDTFYIVAHFHFMFSAATFSAIFASIYYYYNTFFSLKFSRIFSFLHAFYWFGGQWMTFLPLFWVGYNGLPRRYHDYPVNFMGWHGMSSIGHIITLMAIIFFFLMMWDSNYEKRAFILSILGFPRWHKRINYLLFKVKYINFSLNQIFSFPGKIIRFKLSNPYNNENELYEIK